MRGFTLLLSVLVASTLLAIGYEIFNLASKNVLLSLSGRESQFAFFSADSGVECALYADIQLDAFASTSPVTEITCGDTPSTFTRSVQGQTFRTEFAITYGSGLNQQCVNVIVTRTDTPKRTTVESYGHNTCDTTSRTRLERAIRATY